MTIQYLPFTLFVTPLLTRVRYGHAAVFITFLRAVQFLYVSYVFLSWVEHLQVKEVLIFYLTEFLTIVYKYS